MEIIYEHQVLRLTTGLGRDYLCCFLIDIVHKKFIFAETCSCTVHTCSSSRLNASHRSLNLGQGSPEDHLGPIVALKVIFCSPHQQFNMFGPLANGAELDFVSCWVFLGFQLNTLFKETFFVFLSYFFTLILMSL